MNTIPQLRRLAADSRADHEKAPIDPDTLDHLLDLVETLTNLPTRDSPDGIKLIAISDDAADAMHRWAYGPTSQEGEAA